LTDNPDPDAPVPSPTDEKIALAMAYVRKRVAEAPSHEELFAAIEALLRYAADPSVADPPAPEAVEEPAAELGEQTGEDKWEKGKWWREHQAEQQAAPVEEPVVTAPVHVVSEPASAATPNWPPHPVSPPGTPFTPPPHVEQN
jgi:hypothetical protein